MKISMPSFRWSQATACLVKPLQKCMSKKFSRSELIDCLNVPGGIRSGRGRGGLPVRASRSALGKRSHRAHRTKGTTALYEIT